MSQNDNPDGNFEQQIYSQLAKQILAQTAGNQLRKIVFEEHDVNGLENYQQTGLYKINVRAQESSSAGIKLERPTAYCFDRVTLSDIIGEKYTLPTIGMENLGSSCYMNAALQSIFRSQYICSLLLSPYYQTQVQAGN